MPRDFGPPPPREHYRHRGEPTPKGLKNILKHMIKQASGFVSRLFYIVSLVWETAPTILFLLAFFCLLDGVLPVIGAYISKELLNGIADLIGSSSLGNISDDVFITLRPVLFLLLMEFIYLFFKSRLKQKFTLFPTLCKNTIKTLLSPAFFNLCLTYSKNKK